MVEIEIEGIDELEREWASTVSGIGAGTRTAVAAATRAGERVAEAHAPRRTGTLANQIEGRVTSSSGMSADGILESRAPYSSWVADGTRPHEIRPRNGEVLAFQSGGGTVFARVVHHPGTAPHDFMKRGELAAGLTLESEMNRIVESACDAMSR